MRGIGNVETVRRRFQESEDAMIRSFFSSIISIVYLVVGAIVANSHKYFAHVVTFKAGLSAALAVILWPLILFGVNLHLH